MSKFVDKSIYGKIAFAIFVIHTALSLVSIICTLSGILEVFRFGFDMAGVLIILYPIFGGLIYVIVSLIGIIKNRKILPYLVCPIISLIVWLILGGVMAYYV